MGQSVVTIDRVVSQGTAAPGGGTLTVDYAIPTDQCARLVAVAILTHANASHLTAAASLRAEYVVENQNGTLSAPSATTNPVTSVNPLDSTVTGEAAAHVQATDLGFTNTVSSNLAPAINWSISGTNARLTITNNSNGASSIAANVSVIIDAILVGST